MFSRQKKLGPPKAWFYKAIAGGGASEKQSVDQQVSIVRMLGELGGKVTTRAEREAAAAARKKGKGKKT